jgi:hypothetical protein
MLYHAEEIGTSLGTGLSRVRHRVNDFVDEKSRPKDNMPEWWISSTWTNPESDEDDDDKSVSGNGQSIIDNND